MQCAVHCSHSPSMAYAHARTLSHCFLVWSVTPTSRINCSTSKFDSRGVLNVEHSSGACTCMNNRYRATTREQSDTHVQTHKLVARNRLGLNKTVSSHDF